MRGIELYKLFNRLPFDTIFHSLTFLEHKEVASLSLVCKSKWNFSIASRDDRFWKRAFEERVKRSIFKEIENCKRVKRNRNYISKYCAFHLEECKNKTLKRWNEEGIKITLVGPGACGKTFLLLKYVDGTFEENLFIPTVEDDFHYCCRYQNKTFKIHFKDTSGCEEYSALRSSMCYGDTDVFVLCCSLTNLKRYIQERNENDYYCWIREIRTFSKDIPFVLCGTKLDLMDVNNHEEKLTENEINEEIKRIGAKRFFQTSSKNGEGIDEMIKTIVGIAIENEKMKVKEKEKCVIM